MQTDYTSTSTLQKKCNKELILFVHSTKTKIKVEYNFFFLFGEFSEIIYASHISGLRFPYSNLQTFGLCYIEKQQENFPHVFPSKLLNFISFHKRSSSYEQIHLSRHMFHYLGAWRLLGSCWPKSSPAVLQLSCKALKNLTLWRCHSSKKQLVKIKHQQQHGLTTSIKVRCL